MVKCFYVFFSSVFCKTHENMHVLNWAFSSKLAWDVRLTLKAVFGDALRSEQVLLKENTLDLGKNMVSHQILKYTSLNRTVVFYHPDWLFKSPEAFKDPIFIEGRWKCFTVMEKRFNERHIVFKCAYVWMCVLSCMYLTVCIYTHTCTDVYTHIFFISICVCTDRHHHGDQS